MFIRALCVVTVASLPIPLQGAGPGDEAHPAWNARTWRESYEARMGPEDTERTTRSFTVGPNGTLDIANVSGEIGVTEGGSDTITITAVKRARALGGHAREEFARATISMTEQGGRVEVRTTYSGRSSRVSVDYTVTAPAGTRVVAHSVSGNVEITRIRGEVRAEAVSGNVTCTGTPAASLAKSVSGDVLVSGVSSQSDLRASAVSGNVTVRSVRAHGIDADSISGDVQLIDAACERVSAKSISGAVDYTGTIAKRGRYEMKSQSGDVRFTLVGDAGFELEAQTFSGNVRSDVPVTLRPGEPAGGRRLHKAIHGVHGDGSAQLVLSSFSGDVVVVKK